MSGEVNMIQTLRKFRGGPDQANLGGASLETFSGEAQLKKSPCMFSTCLTTLSTCVLMVEDTVDGKDI